MSMQHCLAFQGREPVGPAESQTQISQPACKPGSVWPGAAAPDVTTIPLGRPSPGASSNQPERQGRRTGPAAPEAPRIAPIRSCSRRGLPCRRRCRRRGALLPHPFTLTGSGFRRATGGLLSVALSLGSPPPDVIRRRVRWSPDFPPPEGGGRPADWLRQEIGSPRRGSSGRGRPRQPDPQPAADKDQTDDQNRANRLPVDVLAEHPGGEQRGSGTSAGVEPGLRARRRRARARRSRRKSRDTCSSRRGRPRESQADGGAVDRSGGRQKIASGAETGSAMTTIQRSRLAPACAATDARKARSRPPGADCEQQKDVARLRRAAASPQRKDPNDQGAE